MYQKVYILFFISIFSSTVYAQTNVLNAKTVEQIGKKNEKQLMADNDGPIPYGYVDDRDIMWSKVVWEFVDLNQKINLPYYFPIDTTTISSDKRSLFDTLIRGIKQGKIKEVYSDSYFSSRMTQNEIESKLTSIRENKGYRDTIRTQSEDVTGYMLKGMWYFDKRQGELKYRLLALAPMSDDVNIRFRDDIKEDKLYELFWIFFPSARQVLHDTKVFNPENAVNAISFDHLLNARRFSSVIEREENMYGNRAIADYIRGNSLFQLLEADKIKEDIRNKEMDMWNY